MNQTIIDLKYLAMAPVSSLFMLGTPDPFLELETFCCFVGHGRSGGTLVGSLLNAHPNIVISNEFHAFRLIRKGMTASQMYRMIFLTSGRQVKRGSPGGGGYTYSVEDQSQGEFESLKVIGARKAGATATEIFEYPDLLDKFDENVGLNKKFIHVSRNPFDCITTTFHKTRRRRKEKAQDHLRREIGFYFNRCESVKAVARKFGEDNLKIVHLENVIKGPAHELEPLCRFLGLDASDKFLESCAKVVMKKPNESRRTISWDQDSTDLVNEHMRQFPWLEFYQK